MPKPRQTARFAQPESDIARRRSERRRAVGRRSDDRWRAILDASSRVFRRLGYAQTTLEDVAEEVGVTRASLYYYVGTKEELLIALLYQPMHQMTANLKAIVESTESATEQLRRALRRYTQDMSDTPEIGIFLANNIHQLLSGREADDIARNADEYGRVLQGIIEAGIDAGEFRVDLEPHMTMLWILGAFNWTHRWWNPKGSMSLQDVGEAFAELALATVKA
ncbi:TetR/AcrR family transcriptional regulator [Desertimonas flava]|uniref:TetR/AcrR family transcriptional regulator n=1 Tax=Desertimonas flava TaxID=2064846 RepID=UPI000E344003|nr:TetR/AcrR family transcriptional regulator [Desertimonas flava]